MTIFKDNGDKEKLLERLGENIDKGNASVYAWAVMDNHAHLLIKSGKQGVSDIMRKLLTWYAQYYNRSHKGPSISFQTGINLYFAMKTHIFLPLYATFI